MLALLLTDLRSPLRFLCETSFFVFLRFPLLLGWCLLFLPSVGFVSVSFARAFVSSSEAVPKGVCSSEQVWSRTSSTSPRSSFRRPAGGNPPVERHSAHGFLVRAPFRPLLLSR